MNTAATVANHPVNVSVRNQYATARSSVARFDVPGLVDAIERARLRLREVRASRALRPADLVYLRACLDDLDERGYAHLAAVA